MEVKNGILIVSLDFELYWGLRDKRTIHQYEENLKGVYKAIERILELFDKYEIHATWATVGFLFAKNTEELKTLFPDKTPNYHNTELNPYDYIKRSELLDGSCHYARELVERIHEYKNQEIGTHTFSHYYCLENGQSKEEFSSDVAAAVKIAEMRGISIESLVFPRNQWNNEYLPVLNEHGIKAYRGNEKSWLYKAVGQTEENHVRRALRLLDAYLNLSGANSYDISSLGTIRPLNISSSRFLRPVSKRFSVFEGLRRRRIVNALEQAARDNKVFHLWWHPHNFGVNTDENIEFLESILSSFSDMRMKYQMKSFNMGEISRLIADREKHA